MKRRDMSLKAEKQWLNLLLFTDLFFIFLVWLAGPDTFGGLIVIILLFTAVIVLAGYWLDRIRQKTRWRCCNLF